MSKLNNHDLSSIFICPKTKKPLTYDSRLDALVNVEANIMYRKEDGIFILLEDAGEPLRDS